MSDSQIVINLLHNYVSALCDFHCVHIGKGRTETNARNTPPQCNLPLSPEHEPLAPYAICCCIALQPVVMHLC